MANLTATIEIDYWKGWRHPLKAWRYFRDYRRDGEPLLIAAFAAYVLASMRVR